ncbi:MAG: hypothetical protein ACK4VY_01575 [Brevundimonas sp.]
MTLARILGLAWLSPALLLSGCGPESVRSALNPVRYAVRSDVEVRIEGQARRGAFVQRCSISDQTDSIVGMVLTDIQGDSPWFTTPDGGILIVGGLSPCGWWEKRPAPGTMVDGLRPDLPAVQTTVTWLFDSAERPTRVDVYRAPALMGADGPLAVTAATMTVVSERPGAGLRRAFPGAADFGGWDEKLKTRVTTPFVGIEGRVRPAQASEACLERFTAGVAEGPACPFHPGDLDDQVVAEIRDVAFTVSEETFRFSALEDMPAGLKARLYRQDTLPGEAAAVLWVGARPEVCVQSLCARMPPPMMPIMQIHDRERSLIYEVRRVSHGFSPEEFGSPPADAGR